MRFYIRYLYSVSTFTGRCFYLFVEHSYGFEKKYILKSLDISSVMLNKHKEKALVDLSSAFDAVIHGIFLSRMQNSQDIVGAANTIVHALKITKLDFS